MYKQCEIQNRNGTGAMTRNVKVLILLFNCVINLIRGEAGVYQGNSSWWEDEQIFSQLWWGDIPPPIPPVGKTLHDVFTVLLLYNILIILYYYSTIIVHTMSLCTPAKAKSKMHITVENNSDRPGTTTIICW